MSDKARPPLKPAYLIVGDDLPKVEQALARLRARIVEESGSDADVSEFDARVDGAAAAVGAANTLAFLGGTRLVVVREVQAWLKAEKELLANYLDSPATDACLTLVAEKLAAKDLLRAATAKHGEVLEYPAPKENQLPQWLVHEAVKRLGVDLGLEEARQMVRRCGDNQNVLLRELEKLSIYAEDRKISAEDIRLLGTPAYEANIFSLLDSVALGHGAAAFAAAEELLVSGERPEVLFYRIARNFQQMSRVAAMREEGMSQQTIQAELKMKPYPVRKLTEQAALLGVDGIRHRLAVLAETDARMKGMGTLPDELELQLCLGRLLDA